MRPAGAHRKPPPAMQYKPASLHAALLNQPINICCVAFVSVFAGCSLLRSWPLHTSMQSKATCVAKWQLRSVTTPLPGGWLRRRGRRRSRSRRRSPRRSRRLCTCTAHVHTALDYFEPR